ncbi:hypothetical protein Pyrde_1054 [Pyrodictium delaneyi]|uniref:Uncharacterized protein n=1 Tax=Pyrodictium delaneyi TaxID=1273541 RepID=A0A0P0N378_9CREN|nr:hypothetical protein [Pyrodictium delaneyi]ALL01102.1 hypothetical protein Pyrde_1054 [Pyrodictium delaneyi]
MRLPVWCTWCKDSVTRNGLTPGDLLITDNGNVLLYVRRIHGTDVIVVPKYTAGNGPWSVAYFTTLKRIIKTYSPKDVDIAARIIDSVYSPNYGVKIPVLSLSNFRGLLCTLRPPLHDIIDELNEFTDSVWSMLSETLPGLTECGRPTGSALMGSLRSFSDIDVVYVTDRLACWKTLDEHTQNKHIQPLPPRELQEWANREASTRGLPPGLVAKLYRPWARFVLGRRIVSLVFASAFARWKEERRVVIPGNKVKEIVVRVEPRNIELADFPAIVETLEGIYLVVYDGLFVPPLYDGGRFRVRGITSKILTESGEFDALIIGAREAVTFLEPLQHP